MHKEKLTEQYFSYHQLGLVLVLVGISPKILHDQAWHDYHFIIARRLARAGSETATNSVKFNKPTRTPAELIPFNREGIKVIREVSMFPVDNNRIKENIWILSELYYKNFLNEYGPGWGMRWHLKFILGLY